VSIEQESGPFGVGVGGHKYEKLDESPGSTHNLVIGLVEPGSRVLEFGCATGYMSQALRDRLGATVDM